MHSYIHVIHAEEEVDIGPDLSLGPPLEARIPVYCTLNVHQIISVNTSLEVLLLYLSRSWGMSFL